MYDGEKFSMREFGLWTINGAQDPPSAAPNKKLPRARITKDQIDLSSSDEESFLESMTPKPSVTPKGDQKMTLVEEEETALTNIQFGLRKQT